MKAVLGHGSARSFPGRRRGSIGAEARGRKRRLTLGDDTGRDRQLGDDSPCSIGEISPCFERQSVFECPGRHLGLLETLEAGLFLMLKRREQSCVSSIDTSTSRRKFLGGEG